jgi:hypothetical protein
MGHLFSCNCEKIESEERLCNERLQSVQKDLTEAQEGWTACLSDLGSCKKLISPEVGCEESSLKTQFNPLKAWLKINANVTDLSSHLSAVAATMSSRI